MALAWVLIMKNKAFDLLKHNYSHLLLLFSRVGSNSVLVRTDIMYKYTHTCAACPVCS